MKILLPNMRWLCLPSVGSGEDWRVQSLKIDETLAHFGMDQAEEAIYLLFDRSPGAIMHQEGNCLVARPVIGPKKLLEPPFHLVDWVAAEVYLFDLQATNWSQVLTAAQQRWEELTRNNLIQESSFYLCLRRKLRPALELHVEVIFRA